MPSVLFDRLYLSHFSICRRLQTQKTIYTGVWDPWRKIHAVASMCVLYRDMVGTTCNSYETISSHILLLTTFGNKTNK